MKRLTLSMAALAILVFAFAGCFNPSEPENPELTGSKLSPMSPSAAATVTTEIVLCLDVSGSISQGELQIEVDGLKACLNDTQIVPLDGSAAVAIVVYGATAAKALPALTPITASSLTNTIEPVLDNLLVNRIVNPGATNTGDGLIKSREILATGSTNNQYVLLVGDGASNTGPNIHTQCQLTGNAGITICSIAVGATQAGINELRDCALATGGGFGNAPTFQDFPPVCQQCLFVIFVGQLDLDPDYDLNPTGTSHTVTATALEGNAPFDPIVGVTVHFEVISGPNAGDSGSDVTDANGEATFTYVGDGGIGIDAIRAWMIDPATSDTVYATPVRKEWFNSPPECDAGGDYTVECAGGTTDVQLDGTGSSDPDNDPLTYSWSSNCPGASFDDPTSPTPTLTVDTSGVPVSCTVTLVVSDGLASSQCMATVDIVDTTPPQVVPTGEPIVLWPPNHKYRKISVEDCIAAVIDACDGSVDVSSVKVVGVSSDEVENANGVGDGNTMDDIIIECPNTVYVRSERQGTSNGRVYTIHYEVSDASGNTTPATCHVSVPHDQSGAPAIAGPGPGYSETGCVASAVAWEILENSKDRKVKRD